MEELIDKLKTIEAPTSKKTFSLLEIMYRQVYGKELIQSEMLAGLLRPSENHGHGFVIVENFLRHIGVKLQKYSNLKIETERNANGRRIDIFISWKVDEQKHAVIIENKLNNASNQANQLNDYHDSIINEGYEVEKIVYMPLSKEWQKSEYTDTRKDVLAKTINFDAKDITTWLSYLLSGEECCLDEEGYVCFNSHKMNIICQYQEFLECLISNQHIMQQAIKIQENLSLKEIEKLEKIAEITRTTDWCEVRFRSIVEQIKKGNFTKELLVKYKQNGNYINYAQFYFDNWEETYWYEVWLYPEDGIYVYKYDDSEYQELKKFDTSETTKLAEFIIPLLQELSTK